MQLGFDSDSTRIAFEITPKIPPGHTQDIPVIAPPWGSLGVHPWCPLGYPWGLPPGYPGGDGHAYPGGYSP